jgi:hypothetical protein
MGTHTYAVQAMTDILQDAELPAPGLGIFRLPVLPT